MRKKVFVAGALVVAAAAIGWMAFGGLGENLVYYWSPSELVQAGEKAYGATVRLGGVVKKGTIDWNPRATNLRFQVTDGDHSVKVHARAVPPAMFRENIGVVIEGTLSRANVFESERLLVKHGNEYQPPKDGDLKDMKALMKTLADERASSEKK